MLVFFFLMSASREWLSLTPDEREQFLDAEIRPIVSRYSSVRVTFYDVEAFNARCSDLAVFETSSIEEYTALIDELRNSKIYTVPYFEVTEILPAQQADWL